MSEQQRKGTELWVHGNIFLSHEILLVSGFLNMNPVFFLNLSRTLRKSFRANRYIGIGAQASINPLMQISPANGSKIYFWGLFSLIYIKK